MQRQNGVTRPWGPSPRFHNQQLSRLCLPYPHSAPFLLRPTFTIMSFHRGSDVLSIACCQGASAGKGLPPRWRKARFSQRPGVSPCPGPPRDWQMEPGLQVLPPHTCARTQQHVCTHGLLSMPEQVPETVSQGHGQWTQAGREAASDSQVASRCPSASQASAIGVFVKTA